MNRIVITEYSNFVEVQYTLANDVHKFTFTDQDKSGLNVVLKALQDHIWSNDVDAKIKPIKLKR